MQDAPDPARAKTLPGVVLAAAERYSDTAALEDGDLRLTFRELAAEGLRAARAFIASGLRPGDRVGVWAPNIGEWVIAAIGIQAAGGVLVPLNTRFKGVEAGYVMRKSRAKLVFCMTEFLEFDYVGAIRGEDLPDLERVVSFRGQADGAQSWEAFLAEGEGVAESEARARAEAVGPENLSDLVFTSGTTGSPKGVMTTHGQNVRVFAAYSQIMGLREGDRHLIVNPFFHVFGYKAGWLSSILCGATIIPHAVFDADAVLERVARERISALPGPPTLYQSLLAHPNLADYDLSSLRLALTGAAAIPVELVHKMHDELGFETVLTGYGLTEACGLVSLSRPDDDPETIATTSGRPIPDIEIRCVDSTGNEVPRGEPGELIVRGYNVMRGYFDDEEETRKAIDADGWLHTGDITVMDERGYLRITDRIKDMFINGGFNVYPAEVENLLYGSGKFIQVAVVGVPDERAGEVGMAFVVPTPGEDVTPEGVIAWCRENMANYKVPRRVEIVAELPMTASGKVQKFALRERAAAS